MKKIFIVGAGISGLSISRMLSDKFEVQILERSVKPGGLIKCDRIDGALFHRVGGHVFNSKNKVVLDWFWNHFDRDAEFIQARRNAKILLEGKLIGYPVEDYLYQLPENQARAIAEEIILLMNDEKRSAPADNFKDFLINSFGQHLYDLYFGPYNSKIWNTDISKVPLEWLDGKLPMPSKKNILLNNIFRKEEAEMVHASFYYPRNEGSQFIINRLAEGQQIKLSYEVNTIEENNERGLVINNELMADQIVYCGDVRRLHLINRIKDKALQDSLEAVKDLSSNGTSNVLCTTDDNDLTWLYLPENKFKAHRIIYTGNFSDSNNNEAKRKTCVVEFSGKQLKEDMEQEIKNLPGNLEAIAFNYEPNSYIIHDKNTSRLIANAKAELGRHNIFLLGRFAEWEYYNMDKCIESAMTLSKLLDQ